ncbi:PspA/IM30 family protein [Spirillospora sp. NPDC047279]|uniref:PspA/IM30 family protein n=1 Tax=Spirillospora sp. NPDC047279 TaxID=3155478 RepID=UPI0033D5EE9D
MSEKQSIFGRMTQLLRANVNAALDQAEDPEKMLDQLIRDYTDNIAEAESSIAQTIGNLRLQEADYAKDVEAAQEWGGKALAASQEADRLRTAGNAADAEKFDNLAKVALERQIQAENAGRAAAPMIASQREVVDKLKTGLDQMKGRLTEIRGKRDELVARAKSAQAQAQVQESVKNINVLDPTSDLGRYEDKIRRMEAQVAGQQELAASSLDAQFENLANVETKTEVEARLAAMKAGRTMPELPAEPAAAAPAAIGAGAPAMPAPAPSGPAAGSPASSGSSASSGSGAPAPGPSSNGRPQ